VGGDFLHEIRRVGNTASFWDVCEESLNHAEPMTLEPFSISTNVAVGAC